MNHWLTWRARLAHLLDGENECLCATCCAALRRKTEVARAAAAARARDPHFNLAKTWRDDLE